MFDPINGPPNHYSGPSTGDSTEKGDSWHLAVAKINAGFKSVIAAIEGGVEHLAEVIDPVARKDAAEVREELAALQIKFDALVAHLNAPPVVAGPQPDPPDAELPKDAPPSEAQPQS